MKTVISTFLIITMAVSLGYAQNDSLLVSTSSTFFTPGSSSTLGQILMSSNPSNRTLQILPQRTGDGDVLNGYVFDVAYTNSAAANGFLFRTGSNNRLIIDENGDVGIGTTSPLRKLDIDGSMELSGSIYGKATDHTYYTIANGGNYNHGFFTRTNTGASSERFRIEGGAIIDDILVLNSNFDVNSGQLYVTESTGNVGIGTNTPIDKLDIINAVGETDNLLRIKVHDAPNDYLRIKNATGVPSQFIPSITGFHTSSDRQALYLTGEIADSNDTGSQPIIVFDSRINNSTISNRPLFAWDSYGQRKMILTANGSLGIGTSNPDQKLTVKGKIHSEEIIVDLNVPGPDYVFEDDYELATLEEIEAFIKTNKHLPEIPSAKEMQENGIILGEMNMLLLKKIEELTLYVIAQQKEIQKLKESHEQN